MRKGYKKDSRKGLQEGLQESVRKMLKKGFSPEIVADTLEIPIEDVRKVAESK